MAKASLEKARTGFEYQMAAALDASEATAHQDASVAVAAMRQKAAVPEPTGTSLKTRIVFHLPKGGPGGGVSYLNFIRLARVSPAPLTRRLTQTSCPTLNAPHPLEKAFRIERHFAPDDALADVVHFLGTLPNHQSQESTQWELVEDTKAPPFWWCVRLVLLATPVRHSAVSSSTPFHLSFPV